MALTINHLIEHGFELSEIERAVIECARQPKAMRDKRFLPRTVAGKHAANLRNGLMRFVDNHQELLRKIVDERAGPLPRFAACEMPRIIFDAGAISEFPQHFEVEARSLLDALRFEELSLLAKER